MGGKREREGGGGREETTTMAHSPSPHRTGRRGRGGRGKGRGRGRQDKEKNQAGKQVRWTKLAVRGLPSGLSRASFLEHVQGMLGEGAVGWCHYLPGKEKGGKRNTSVALVGINDEALAKEFQHKMQGHTFVDAHAREHQVDVERAPWQRIPRPTRKKDPLEGTLENDPHYQEFLQRLDEEQATLPRTSIASVSDRLTPSDAKPTVVVTPLMEYLRKKHEKNSRSKGKVKKTTGEGKEGSRGARPTKGPSVGEPRQHPRGTSGGDASSAAAASTAKSVRPTKGGGGGRSRSKKGAAPRAPSVEPEEGTGLSKRPSPSRKPKRKAKPLDARPRSDGTAPPTPSPSPSTSTTAHATASASVKLFHGAPTN